MLEFYNYDIAKSLQELDSSELGLSSAEAKKRLKVYGPNIIQEKNKTSRLKLFVDQFQSPLIYILLIAAVLAYFLGQHLNAGVILAVVLINVFFGFLHEAKAEQALDELAKIITSRVQIKRGGDFIELPAAEIVPGDIIAVESGMKVPADIRIIECHDIQIDESVLTGESLPISKKETVIALEAKLDERINMLYAGTSIISGRGLGVAVETGLKTEFGKIAKEVDETAEEQTSLQIRLNVLSKRLLSIIVVICILILVIGYFKNMHFYDLLFIVVAMAIAAIPEGLPAVITITLAYGAYRMAKKKAIVKRLAAVETLGSITVIASDKTGTLTHNQQTVEKIFVSGKTFAVSGSGYEPKGEFESSNKLIDPAKDKDLAKILQFGMLCNDAKIYEKNDNWLAEGDPTEGALICVGEKASLDHDLLDEKMPRLDEIPFSTDSLYMATLHTDHGKKLIIVKGAFEKVLNISKHHLAGDKKHQLTTENRNNFEKINHQFARQALRVIAFAYKEVPAETKVIDKNDISNLTFLGLVGMIDPPRKEAAIAIAKCMSAGIRPIMITGDFPETAKAVAIKLGILRDYWDSVITNEELEKLNWQKFSEAVRNNSVFARITPEMKLKIVRVLQENGEIVAVTGDGINDAPALKQADIGVAMGQGGTDVSREVADLVLMDNNFATIVAAIEEGRTIFQNIRRTIFYLLSTNAAELLVVALTLIFGWPLILIPVQMLWMNLVTDGTADIALALEPTHHGLMKFKPRGLKEPILSKLILLRIFFVSATLTIISIIIFKWQLDIGASEERARTIAFAFLIVSQLFNTFNSRSLSESIFKMPFFSNPYIIGSVILSFVLSIATIYGGFAQKLFSTAPLLINDWLIIFGLSLIVIFVVETEKFIRRRFNFAT